MEKSDSVPNGGSPARPVVAAGLSPEEKGAIREELERVLRSEGFHSSPRCQEFLRYVVEHALEGATEQLKERNIGVDVFRRSPSYEPNNDAIVRVRATEVRKRLTQYYDHYGGTGGLRIVLPPGSYVPEFHRVAAEPVVEAAVAAVEAIEVRPRRSRRLLWWGGAAAAIMIAAWGTYFRPGAQSTPLRDFWAPSLRSANPVVICLGQPVVYHLSKRVHERYLKTQPKDRLPGPYVIPLKPGEIEASDVIPVPDQYVGAGSAQAAARISALLAGWNKRSQLRVGNDFSFYDLRNYPAVLEGAFSNQWTMQLGQRMPLVFVEENGVRGIREKANPKNAWFLPALGSDGKTTEDYAVAGRVFDSGTLEPLVFAAGITQYGTQAAGEFLANEDAFAAAMARAPADWRERNLQVLLHLKVIAKVPGKPEVVAIRTW
jgi:hypothetical protein